MVVVSQVPASEVNSGQYVESLAREGYPEAVYGGSMATAKEQVQKILDQLPDNSSFEDIQYHIWVREKTERGLKDIEEGRVLTQDEVERRMSRWLDA